MNVSLTHLPGVLLIEPKVVGDARGFFMETYHARRYAEAGLEARFVQDNLSFSRRGTLRGLHYQQPHAQGKLVYVLQGEVFDVAVDIREGSGKLYLSNKFPGERNNLEGSTIVQEKEFIDSDNFFTVEKVDFVSFIKELDRKVSLIKMDIEGAELSVLSKMLEEGMLDTVDRML